MNYEIGMKMRSEYGCVPDLDLKIRKIIKSRDKNKQYLVIDNEGRKQYFLYLHNARYWVNGITEQFRDVTDADVQADPYTGGAA